MTLDELAKRHCGPVSVPTDRLTQAEIAKLMTELPDWNLTDGRITKRFQFDGFEATMAFVNGVAWLAQRENHHPDMTLGYTNCSVSYSTHDVGGLSLNDFICAAKIELLRIM